MVREVIEGLIEVLRDGSQETKAHAAGALRNMGLNSYGQDVNHVIHEVGGIWVLMHILRQDFQPAWEAAAGALEDLAWYSRSQAETGKVIKALVEMLHEGHEGAQAHVTRALCNLAASSEYHNLMLDVGGIKALIEVLHDGSEEVQERASFALRSLAMQINNQDVIYDIIRALIKVMHEGSQYAQKRAVSALRELAGNDQNRDVIRNEGGMRALVNLRVREDTPYVAERIVEIGLADTTDMDLAQSSRHVCGRPVGPS